MGVGPGLGSLHPGSSPSRLSAYLLVEQAEHHEEEEALQAVEQGEDVGEPCAVGVKEEQAEDPGTAQHHELGNGCDGQHPVERAAAVCLQLSQAPCSDPSPPQSGCASLPRCPPSHLAFLSFFMFGLISENLVVSFQTVITKMAELHWVGIMDHGLEGGLQ